MGLFSKVFKCFCRFLGLTGKSEVKQINDRIQIENSDYKQWADYEFWRQRQAERTFQEDFKHISEAIKTMDGKCCNDCQCDNGRCCEGECEDCKCGRSDSEKCCGSCSEEVVIEPPVKKAKSRKVYHVVPDPKGGWAVKEEKNKNPSVRTEKKTEAVAKAKELAKKAKLGQVIVHKKDGKIQIEYTYGEDPIKTKG